MRFFLLVFFCLNSMLVFSQEKLDRSKEELKQGNQEPAPYNGYSGDTYTDNKSPAANYVENQIGRAVAGAIVYGIYYAFIGDYEVERHLSNRLTKYPFEHRSAGNYMNRDSIPRPKYFRIDIENQFLYNSDDLFGNHLKVNIRPFQYFYLQTNVFLLNEIDDFNQKRSTLNLFNLEFCYDRIRTERFNIGFTLGANYIGNDVQLAGFAYGLCTELFLLQSFSVYSCGKLSAIHGLPVNQFEVKGKYHHKKLFLSAGYEYLKIASPSYHFLSVGGGIYL